jgi:N-acyl-D-aspartate/D-glutamate deacylase
MKARGIGLNIALFLGFFDRGFIRPTKWADLVIFNPKRVTNKAT